MFRLSQLRLINLVVRVPPEDMKGVFVSKAPKPLLPSQTKPKDRISKNLIESLLRDGIFCLLAGQLVNEVAVMTLMTFLTATRGQILNLTPGQPTHLTEKNKNLFGLLLRRFEGSGRITLVCCVPEAKVRMSRLPILREDGLWLLGW